MANKKLIRYLIDREKFFRILKTQKTSMRKMGEDSAFNWSEKSIRRALKEGASANLLTDLSIYLNVPTQMFSTATCDNTIIRRLTNENLLMDDYAYYLPVDDQERMIFMSGEDVTQLIIEHLATKYPDHKLTLISVRFDIQNGHLNTSINCIKTEQDKG